MRKTIGFKTLHASTLMIHADDDVRTNGANGANQFRHLRAIFKITPEQNHAASHRICQTTAILIGQGQPRQIHDHRTQSHIALRHSFPLYFFRHHKRTHHIRLIGHAHVERQPALGAP